MPRFRCRDVSGAAVVPWQTITVSLAPAPQLSAGARLQGSSGDTWTVGRPIGLGGTAAVFEVQNEGGVSGAAKVLSGHRFPIDRRAQARFAREGRHLARLNHLNVLSVLDVVSHGDVPVLVLQRAAGTLYEILSQRTSPVPIWLVAVWLTDLLAGAAALHDAQLVHRDLTPKNLLFDQGGHLMIGDFGAIRHGDDRTLTTDADALGSLVYISRQQFQESHNACPNDDVFSLGQICYELLAGFRPVGNVPPILTIRDSVPQALAELVERMRSDDPSIRPEDGGAALSDLRQILAGARRAPAGRLIRIWKGRQLEAVDRIVNIASSRAVEQLRAVVAELGPVRLGVEGFLRLPEERVGESVELSTPTPSDMLKVQSYSRGALALLGTGGARFHADWTEGGGMMWSTVILLNRLNGAEMTMRSFDSLAATDSLSDLRCVTDPTFWACFDTKLFLHGAACTDCGSPLCLSVDREDLEINSYGTYKWVARPASCPNEPEVEPPRCCICGERLVPAPDHDEHGRYDAVGCACSSYAIQVDYHESPWNWTRLMRADDIPTHLETHMETFGRAPLLNIGLQPQR